MCICLFTRAKSGREMTDCILSLPLRTVTDKHLCISSKKRREDIAVVKIRKCNGNRYFFETSSAFDIFQSRSNNNNFCNYGALRVSI